MVQKGEPVCVPVIRVVRLWRQIWTIVTNVTKFSSWSPPLEQTWKKWSQKRQTFYSWFPALTSLALCDMSAQVLHGEHYWAAKMGGGGSDWPREGDGWYECQYCQCCRHSKSFPQKPATMTDFLDDLTNLPADIQNYMRKLAELDIFLTGQPLWNSTIRINFKSNLFRRRDWKLQRSLSWIWCGWQWQYQ